MEVLNDIVTRKDIEILVNRFYERVQAEPLLAPRFSHVDWPAHLPLPGSSYSSKPLTKILTAAKPTRSKTARKVLPWFFSTR
jgi:hypothetical protein